MALAYLTVSFDDWLAHLSVSRTIIHSVIAFCENTPLCKEVVENRWLGRGGSSLDLGVEDNTRMSLICFNSFTGPSVFVCTVSEAQNKVGFSIIPCKVDDPSLSKV